MGRSDPVIVAAGDIAGSAAIDVSRQTTAQAGVDIDEAGVRSALEEQQVIARRHFIEAQ